MPVPPLYDTSSLSLCFGLLCKGRTLTHCNVKWLQSETRQLSLKDGWRDHCKGQ